MRNIKKLVGLALALALALSLAIPAAFAANTGKITITDPIPGTTYTLYRIFDLESFDATTNNYNYKVNKAWQAFVETDAAKTYIDVDPDTGLVSWKLLGDNGEQIGAADFAKLALEYAEANITGSNNIVAQEGKDVVFTGLDWGYYLVDSSAGILCGLTTTNPTAEVAEKNGKPTVDKQILEDGQEKKTNAVNIGDTITYQATINAQPGSHHFILHDRMSTGLTFDQDSVVVTIGTNTIADSYYSVVPTPECDKDCTFHVVFTDAFTTYVDGLYPDDPDEAALGIDIVIVYNAVLNESAVIAPGSNDNEVILEFNEGNETEKDTTTTFTYEFDLVKTKSNNDNGTADLLDGAQFTLYDAETEGNAYTFVKDGDTYRMAIGDEAGTTTIDAGTATIVGLGDGVYWLEETQAPDGYNKLTKRIKVEVVNKSLKADFDTRAPGDGEGTEHIAVYDTSSDGVQVINQSGGLLPSTGGMGTTIFYIGGGILAVGAVILLVVRRRMRVDAE